MANRLRGDTLVMDSDQPGFLERLISGRESELVEFKREWYDLQQKEGKATFAKDVLALANTVRPESPGFLLIGVTDDGTMVGVKAPPDAETVSNILSSYVHPPAPVQCRHHTTGDVVISVLTVAWTPARPHHSLRSHPGILATDAVYVRRDRTIGTATLPELEAMIREKDAHIGPYISGDPIQCGFVQKMEVHTGRPFVARVTNLTTEAITDVSVTIDVRNARNPDLFFRSRKLMNAALNPGESQEVELANNDITFYLATFDRGSGDRGWTNVGDVGRCEGDRWLDVTLHVDYRDRSGMLSHVARSLSVDV